MADCYVIALAKLEGAAALSAKREKDLADEIKRRPFGVEILFLQDRHSSRKTS